MHKADFSSLPKDRSVLISFEASRTPSILFRFIYDFILHSSRLTRLTFFCIPIRASTTGCIKLLNDLHNLQFICFIHSADHIVFKSEFLTMRSYASSFHFQTCIYPRYYEGTSIKERALLGTCCTYRGNKGSGSRSRGRTRRREDNIKTSQKKQVMKL